MQYSLNITTPPNLLPITIDYAAIHARIDDENQMAALPSKIATASIFAEKYLNRTILPSTYQITFFNARANNDNGFFNSSIAVFPLALTWEEFYRHRKVELPYGPVTTVNSVTIEQWSGETFDWVEGTDFFVDNISLPSRIKYHSLFPRDLENIQISYQANGYGTPDNVPAPIKEAIAVMVTNANENRGDFQSPTYLTQEVKNMLAPYKVWTFYD